MIDRSVVTSIVVAGGKGRRFGPGKLSETIGGRTLLQRVIDSLSLVSDKILVAVAPGQPTPDLSPASAEVVVDLYPGKSTLGGIYTGLAASRSFHSLVVAADMPFLNTSLLGYMIECAPAFDVVMPRIGSDLEPLHAIYSKNCLAPMQWQIERDQLKIREFLQLVRVRYVEQAEIDRFDPKHLSFFNINTADDLNRARALLEEFGDAEKVDEEGATT